MSLGLHSQEWWAAGQEHPCPPGRAGGDQPLLFPTVTTPGCYQQQPADTMVFQSKHADTRGNFHLNSSCLSFCPRALQKHDKCLCGERGLRDPTQNCSHSPLPGSATASQIGTAGQSAGQADFTSKRKKIALFWSLRFCCCCCFIYYFVTKVSCSKDSRSWGPYQSTVPLPKIRGRRGELSAAEPV